MVSVFGGVHDDGEAGGDGGDDEENLGGHRGEACAGEDGVGDGGGDEEFHRGGDEDGAGRATNFGAVEIDADDEGDEDDEGAGEMFQDGPERRVGEVVPRGLEAEPGNRGVEGGHFVNIGEKRFAGDMSGADAGRRDDIYRDVQEDHEQYDVAHGFAEVGGIAVRGVGGVAVNENGEGAADISCIGIGAGGAKNAALAVSEAKEAGGKKGNRRHGDEKENFCQDELPGFGAGTVLHHGEEDETGQHDVDDEFIEGGQVDPKFRVQPKTCRNKEEERQDVVAENGENGHGVTFRVCEISRRFGLFGTV